MRTEREGDTLHDLEAGEEMALAAYLDAHDVSEASPEVVAAWVDSLEGDRMAELADDSQPYWVNEP